MVLLDGIGVLVGGAIFAVHSIHTEVVAWVASVTELEMAIFYLASFIFFLRLGSLSAAQRTKTGILMYACFALALLSKEQAMTLAVLATIYEHFYRLDRETTSWKTKAYRYGGFWIIAAVYLVFRVTVLGGLAPVRQHPAVTWTQAFLSAFTLVGQYIAKLFWPLPLLAFLEFHKRAALSDPRVFASFSCGVVCVT